MQKQQRVLKQIRLLAGKLSVTILIAGLSAAASGTDTDQSWPPPLKGCTNSTITLTSDLFLKIPPAVQAAATNKGAARFVLAKTAPTVDLALHGPLPDKAINGTGWTSWGDICVASDGKVYCGIGDHGNDAGGKSRAFVFQWDPVTKALKQVVDVNQIVERRRGEPTWSKIHARIDEATNGNIYFSGTLNDGNSANQPGYKWSEAIPGGQLYQYDPRTGKAVVFSNLPEARCTATSLLDRERNIWWCNLEAGSNALFALDLSTKKVVFKGFDGSVVFNRNFALTRDGAVYFNGPGGIWKYDPRTNGIARTKSAFPGEASMRASTRESKEGYLYGVTTSPGQFFRYSPAQDKLDMFGPDFLDGNYTTVCVLSPDERYVYYLPGAHGGALQIGTPVVQYEIATGQRKVIAFLRDAFEKQYDYAPAGTYGVKMSADGSTLYVNFNGHAGDSIRPKEMSPIGFGLTAFAAIHIPASER